jgi:hypothetical protein
MDVKLKDIQVADDILDIINEEVQLIKKEKAREPSDIVRLVSLAKTYQIIMASNREMFKSGLLGNLSDKELLDSDGDTYEDAEDTDDL